MGADPPENYHLTVKNYQKHDIFFKKLTIVVNFFGKKYHVFGNFFHSQMAIFRRVSMGVTQNKSHFYRDQWSTKLLYFIPKLDVLH